MGRRHWDGRQGAPSSFRLATFPSTGRSAMDWSSSANMKGRQFLTGKERQFLTGLPRPAPEVWVLRVFSSPHRPQMHRNRRTIERLLARCRERPKCMRWSSAAVEQVESANSVGPLDPPGHSGRLGDSVGQTCPYARLLCIKGSRLAMTPFEPIRGLGRDSL